MNTPNALYAGAIAIVVIGIFYFKSGTTVVSNGGHPAPYKRGRWFDDQVYNRRSVGDGLFGRSAVQPLPGSNKKTFEVIDYAVEGANPGLSAIGKDGGGYWHLGRRLPFNPIKDKLRWIQQGAYDVVYYATAEKVYFRDGDQISDSLGADPASLRPIQPAGVEAMASLLPYYRDRAKVYFIDSEGARIVSGAKPATFQFLFNSGSKDFDPQAPDAKDGQFMFRRGVRM